MVSVAMPLALSVTVIVPCLATMISISGGTSLSSAASSALSNSSLSMTSVEAQPAAAQDMAAALAAVIDREHCLM